MASSRTVRVSEPQHLEEASFFGRREPAVDRAQRVFVGAKEHVPDRDAVVAAVPVALIIGALVISLLLAISSINEVAV